jgi:hypothetical protein
MVARGKISLRKAFVIAVWGFILNTIIGPVMVGVLPRKAGAL